MNWFPRSSISQSFGANLRAYFASGWAFLIPYLTAYLLYAWLGWPVNPAGQGEEPSAVSGQPFGVPSLLHVYWFLHAIHLLLASVALSSWWRKNAAAIPPLSAPRHPLLAPFSRIQFSAVWPLVPWFLLALIFWIPGIYLEWPSDPWEHLRRINEWHVRAAVVEHSSWKKSSYFLPYSLTGHTTGLEQLRWLNIYYTVVCLLLSWQYYRLARAVGLSERASFVFVVLNALTFGNNIFSFFRYYGLSSSIFAQLGAVALMRITLEAVDPSGQARAATGSRIDVSSLPAPRYALLRPSVESLLLLPLIAFNHIQGIGIAGLGVFSILAWRLVAWRRTAVWWIIGGLAIASVAVVLWYPRNGALFDYYRSRNWLSPLLGFDIFDPTSPAWDRMLQILGIAGVLNLTAGILAFTRNHVAGWIVSFPLMAIALPCFAIPLAQSIGARNGGHAIVAFHRMLLAIPTGLALIVVISDLLKSYSERGHSERSRISRPGLRHHLADSRVTVGIAVVLIVSARSPTYNRFWHGIQVTPDDLNLRHCVAAWIPENLVLAESDTTLAIVHPISATARAAFRAVPALSRFRTLHPPVTGEKFAQSLDWLNSLKSAYWVQTHMDQGWSIFSSARTEPSDPVRVTFTASSTPNLSLEPALQGNRQVTFRTSPGAAVELLSTELIPVDRAKRYRLVSIVRQSGNPSANNYLAVAWYDVDGRRLRSNLPQPEGAGRPRGWTNGTYSYYGLVNHRAPEEWTPYSITFGLGQAAAIPANAAFFRAGALLNFNSAPHAVVSLSDITLTEDRSLDTLLLVAPSTQQTFSPASFAAHLSRHWLPQAAHTDLAGSEELRRSIRYDGERASF